jgi:hypothetical protein
MGGGPPYVRLGPRRVAYEEAASEAWAASRSFTSRAAELAMYRTRFSGQ